MKKILTKVSIFATLAFAVNIFSAYAAGEENSLSAAEKSVQGCVVAQRTEEEIREYIKNHPFELYISPSYSVSPDTSSNVIGKLSDETLRDSINALNTMRFIAGLSEVELDDYYSELTQAASFVNSINNELSHRPTQPPTVSDEVYEKAYTGASHSNIAMGYVNPASSVVYGYMDDSDYHNIDRVGHRRWCLNPSMEKTGFGQVGRYSAMYAFDGSFGNASEYNVCWPAQKMPVEYFDGSQAWSLSTGSYVDEAGTTVTLTRKSDSKVWSFGANGADGEFYVENSYYGQMGCIIFRPYDIDYKAGDSFSVLIETGTEAISYDVDFFMAGKCGDINGDDKITTVDAKWVLQAISGSRYLTREQRMVADVNGDGTVTTVDAKWILQAVSGSRTL